MLNKVIKTIGIIAVFSCISVYASTDSLNMLTMHLNGQFTVSHFSCLTYFNEL